MDVFEYDDERLSGGLKLEELPRSPEDLVQWVVGFSQPNGRGHPRYRVFAAWAGGLKKFRARFVGCVVSRIAAASRTISTSGQKVIPRPYGRQRPFSTRALGWAALTNSSIRRDLPTPAWAMMVTRRHESSRAAGRELVCEDRQFPCASYKWVVVFAFDTFRLPCRDEPVGRYALCFPL